MKNRHLIFGAKIGSQIWEQHFGHNMLKVNKSFGQQGKTVNIICKLKLKNKETLNTVTEFLTD